MSKLIAAINMTIDGFCDHTAGIVNDEIHEHYNELLRGAGALLYGRITYQLMESYWPSVVDKPTGNKPIDDFAVLIDNIPKVVYSRTLQGVDWKNTELKHELNAEDIRQMVQRSAKPVFAGSPSLISTLTQMGLVDEYQLCIHPLILGHGLPLFRNITNSLTLQLLKTKTFTTGAVIHYYQPAKAPTGA